jgi:shikimate kinase
MNNILLLVGPSGVGKSSSIREIPFCDALLIHKLDDMLKEYNEEPSISKYFDRIGNKAFFEKSIEAIERLSKESHAKQILIDVGAGSIDWEGCTDIYLNYRIVSLTGDKEILYNRIKTRALENGSTENRTLEQYVKSEFMPHKMTLYEKATFNIDTTKLSKGDIAKKIIEILKAFRSDLER